MFADAALAARIDGAEARLSGAVAAAVDGSLVTTLGTGAAVLVRPGSPANKIIGLALDGPPDEIALHRVEEAWKERVEPVRVELSSLADPEAGRWLTERGYHLMGFENVLIRELRDVPARATAVAIDRAPDRDGWLDVIVEGFAHGDGSGVEAAVEAEADAVHDALDSAMRDFARADGFTRYLARIDGAPAGAASMRLDGGVALLCGAATLPPARRRGVQAALLAARLADARAAGCDVAVVTTAPGSLSQRNVERNGFQLAYARAVLVRSW